MVGGRPTILDTLLVATRRDAAARRRLRRAERLLEVARDAIVDEVAANADAMDHPTIRAHDRVVRRIDKFLAEPRP